MPDTEIEIYLPDAKATTLLGQRIAPLLHAGDCLLLSGPIGAGKSHFARAVIQARLAAVGKYEDVPSPTFTIVQIYDDGLTEIWHSDLYRLSDSAEIDELGLEDAFGTGITLVEWPDRLGETTPKDALSLIFETSADHEGRILKAKARTGNWQNVLNEIGRGPH